MHQLTVFFDGHCPLCTKEISLLKQFDTRKKLHFEDIHAIDFAYRYPYIDVVAADKRLHGQLASGQIITGLDVTAKAWGLVGHHKWLQILRWPVIRWFADLGYMIFARFRHPIARLFGDKSCQDDNCKF
jgi:predicted DCC family thiol-disulfide oxidoreductase YuxK